MPNDDGLKDYLVDDSTPIKNGQVTDWLHELLDTRTEMRIIRRAMMRYVERNIELTAAACDAKKNLEYWVTQAGLAEARLQESEVKLDDALRNKDIIAEWLGTKDELLWWITAWAEHESAGMNPLRQMLTTQDYTKENMEKK